MSKTQQEKVRALQSLCLIIYTLRLV